MYENEFPSSLEENIEQDMRFFNARKKNLMEGKNENFRDKEFKFLLQRNILKT